MSTDFSPTTVTETSNVNYATDGSITTAPPPMEPMFYRLNEEPSREVLTKIKELTNNFDASTKMTPEFVASLTERLDVEATIMEGFLYAPTNSDICRQVIGKDGCYFHMTTSQQDIAMIWHDRAGQRPIFRFWGEKFRVIKAMNIIRHRIHMKTHSV